jgi:hypothetical protein
METKIKDKTNRLEHKLVIVCIRCFGQTSLKLLSAINDQPSLVFTAAFFKMWLTKLTYHYTPQRVVFEYGCPYTVLAVAITPVASFDLASYA